MSYHHCPIEPSDWSDGPDYGPECRECEGVGSDEDENGKEIKCEHCGGTGVEPYDDYYEPAGWHDE